MSQLLIVSNGHQFFQIPPEELGHARQFGFYLPRERARTIVSDGNQILEIPLTDVSHAAAEGFRDILNPQPAAAPSVAASQPAVVRPSDAFSENTNESSETTNADESPSAYRQAELDEEAQHEQLVQEYAEASLFGKLPALVRLTWFRYHERLARQLRTNGVSVALHIAILLLLSAVLLVDENIRDPNIITVSSNVEDPIEEVIIETVEVEVTEPVEEPVEEVSESIEVVSEVTEQFVSIDVADALDGDLLSAPEAGSSEGDGEAMEKPTKAKVKFFGAKTEAIDFVFVIDNSNSMTKGRFETALNELVKAVNNLNRRQRFYVIFYSDTAYPLFHPQSPRTMVPATQQNKVLLSRWLQTVPLCLKTNGKEALNLALSLKPDVVFVLGDGAFTDGASRFYSSNPVKGIVMHTLGMEVSPKNAMSFKALADAHGGTYQDVGVHPQAIQIAQKFPRKRNNQRNGFWGLKLPARKNK